MKVLVVDAFSSSASGRSSFSSFFDGVKYAFSDSSLQEVPTATGDATQFDVESLASLSKYCYAYEGNEYTDPRAVDLFDRVDCIFVDCDRRLMPWGAKTRPLLLLLKTAFFTHKPVFAAGSAAQFVAFVLATGGSKLNVLNGEGSKLEQMAAFQVPSVVGPDDSFLDSTSGDYFSLRPNADGTAQWVPKGSIGSHVHDPNAHLVTEQFCSKPPSPRKKSSPPPPTQRLPSYPVKAIMAGEVKVHIKKPSLKHYLFKNFLGDSDSAFLAPCDNRWSLDEATNARSKVRYEVLAESERGPQVIVRGNMLAVQFHLDKRFSQTYEIARNYSRNLLTRMSSEGRLDVSCSFLKNGDPNLKPKKSVLSRPFEPPKLGVQTFSAVEAAARGPPPPPPPPAAKRPSSAAANGDAGKQQQKRTTTSAGEKAPPPPPAAESARSKGSTTTVLDKYDPAALAAEGYATPRFILSQPALTPRDGVRIAPTASQEDTLVEGKLSGRMTDRTDGRSSVGTGASQKSFDPRILGIAKRLGVDMAFAIEHNKQVERESNARMMVLDLDSDDGETEGDGKYFDDVSHSDSWAASEQEGYAKKVNENRPPTTSLNLGNLHSEIAWGNHIKVDSEPLRLASRQRARTPEVERAETRADPTKVVKVRPPVDERRQPYNMYKKYEKMAEKDAGPDWYIFNDGTPYISSSERALKEENFHRRRGNEDGPTEIFHNVCGKRSAMRLPDKHGVAANGPYYGKVECSSQLDEFKHPGEKEQRPVRPNDKSKWMHEKGWIYNGDRQKPAVCERKGRYKFEYKAQAEGND